MTTEFQKKLFQENLFLKEKCKNIKEQIEWMRLEVSEEMRDKLKEIIDLYEKTHTKEQTQDYAVAVYEWYAMVRKIVMKRFEDLYLYISKKWKK